MGVDNEIGLLPPTKPLFATLLPQIAALGPDPDVSNLFLLSKFLTGLVGFSSSLH